LNAGAPTTPPHEATRGAEPALPTLPGYEVLAELGRGGMGVVYRARQVGLDRLVALKMILGGAHADEQDLARFRTEAEAVARLQHPHIVQIHDIGAHDGLPFFSLEFCGGGSLAARLNGTPLQPRQAAQLVETLARAMQAAHEHQIVHRDLKPANILLASGGREPPGDGALPGGSRPPLADLIPKIADFGLAKKLDAGPGQTQSGAIVGTPSYMAPEQAFGQQRAIGPAADVYALGAILYELLTGRPPFKAATPLDTVIQVVTDEPVPPSRLIAKLPRDLETICLKCLQKDPKKRFGSARALAEDLRRFQAGEPIIARPVGRLERTVKWVRRNPALAACLAAVLLLLVGGGVAALWYQGQRAEAGRKLALTELAVQQGLDQAQRGHAQLLAALKKPGGVQDLLNQPARWEAEIKAARGDWQRAHALATNAEGSLDPELAARLQKLDCVLARDQADYQLARRLEKIRLDRAGGVGRTLDRAQAERQYLRAFQDAGLAIAPGRQKEVARLIQHSPIKEQLLASMDDWAESANWNKNVALCRRLVEVACLADPDPWRVKVRDLRWWKDSTALGKLADTLLSDQAALARLSPQMLSLVSFLLPDAGKERWLRRGQALHPADFWLNFELALALHRAGERAVEAAGFYRVALAIRPNTSAVYNNLGSVLYDQKDLPAASDAFHNALALDPRNALAWSNLSLLRRVQNQLPAAIDAARKALALDPKYALAWNNLGCALLAQNDLPAASDALRKGLALDPTHFKGWYDLGHALYQQKNYPAASDACSKALALDPRNAMAWSALGINLDAQKDFAGAIAAYNKALALDPKYAAAWINLGSALHEQKDLPAAIAAYQKALALEARDARPWYGLANTLRDHNDLPAAVAAYQKAIQCNPAFAEAHCNLGHTLKNLGNLGAALTALEKGHQLGSRRKGWPYASADWVNQCRQLLALDQQLNAVLQRQTATAEERLRLADQCVHSKLRYADAVTLYAAAFAAEPRWAEALDRGHRYNAAFAAALAAADQGIGAGQRTEKDKARLRSQARAWLQADLAARARLLDQQPLEAFTTHFHMQHWQGDPDLAGVRDEKELARLPAEERASWTKLWAEVAALRQQARARYVETVHQGQLDPKQREQPYPLRMTAGRTYVIELASQQFNAYLRLHDEQGKVVAENDGISKDNRNARIIFKPPRDGTYRILATCSRQRGVGGYTVTIREFSPTKK
jgi:serine/threonine-protein kinase